MHHALDLEEIRCRIGLYLPLSSISACSRVSSAWRETFLPLCWRHITLDCHQTYQPPVRLLSNHASYIRSITYNGTVSPKHRDFAINIQKSVGPLTSLQFFDGEQQGQNYHWNMILTMVSIYRSTLKGLHLRNIRVTPPRLFWITISTHCHRFGDEGVNQPECEAIWSYESTGLGTLRHLTLSLDDTLNSFEWCQMLSSFQNLQSLELGQLRIAASLFAELDLKYKIRNWPVTPEQPRFKFIHYLKLDRLGNLRSIVCLRAIIFQCQALRSLHWRIKKGQAFPGREFSNMLICGSWPYLDTLEVWCSMTKIEDGCIAKILRHRPRFKKLCVKGSKVGDLSISEISSPAVAGGLIMTLQELDFSRCDNVTSANVLFLLSSCPNLVSFSANKIDLEDAANDSPWICGRLRNLALYFDFGSPSNSRSEQTWVNKPNVNIQRVRTVYDKLSKLTQLETLDLQRYFHSKLLLQASPPPVLYGSYLTLKMQLTEGLESLSTLKNLCRIFLQYGVRDLGVEEAKWMRENWPQLEALNCEGNLQSSVKDIFESPGPDGKRVLCGWKLHL